MLIGQLFLAEFALQRATADVQGIGHLVEARDGAGGGQHQVFEPVPGRARVRQFRKIGIALPVEDIANIAIA